MTGQTNQLAVAWIESIIVFGMYSLLGYVGLHRQHKNVMPIFLTNAFFGWPVIGLIDCLIWSVSDHVQTKTDPSVDGKAT